MKRKINLKLLDDRVAVLPMESAKKSKGGVILPDQAQERPDRGTVVAVGNGLMLKDGTRVEPYVEVGDLVLYPKHGGTKVELDGVVYLIHHERDLFGVINNE